MSHKKNLLSVACSHKTPPGALSARWMGVILLLLIFRVSAQEWQTGGLDVFVVEEDGKMILESRTGLGYALRTGTPPSFPSRYWVDVDLWMLTSPGNAEGYFVFGCNDSTGIPQIWAAGYSLSQKCIIVGALEIEGANSLYFREIARKTVEIINRENKYVFRTIIPYDRHEIIFEVNGVPLVTGLPGVSREMRQFGFMVRNGKVRFSALRWGGE